MLTREQMRVYMNKRRALMREKLPLTLTERVEVLEAKVEDLESRPASFSTPPGISSLVERITRGGS